MQCNIESGACLLELCMILFTIMDGWSTLRLSESSETIDFGSKWGIYSAHNIHNLLHLLRWVGVIQYSGFTTVSECSPHTGQLEMSALSLATWWRQSLLGAAPESGHITLDWCQGHLLQQPGKCNLVSTNIQSYKELASSDLTFLPS